MKAVETTQGGRGKRMNRVKEDRTAGEMKIIWWSQDDTEGRQMERLCPRLVERSHNGISLGPPPPPPNREKLNWLQTGRGCKPPRFHPFPPLLSHLSLSPLARRRTPFFCLRFSPFPLNHGSVLFPMPPTYSRLPSAICCSRMWESRSWFE